MMSNGSGPVVCRAACASSGADGAHPFLNRGALTSHSKFETGRGGRTCTVEIGKGYKPGLVVYLVTGRPPRLLHFSSLELRSESMFSGSESHKPALQMIYLPLICSPPAGIVRIS